jgi:hypothetical protein
MSYSGVGVSFGSSTSGVGTSMSMPSSSPAGVETLRFDLFLGGIFVHEQLGGSGVQSVPLDVEFILVKDRIPALQGLAAGVSVGQDLGITSNASKYKNYATD